MTFKNAIFLSFLVSATSGTVAVGDFLFLPAVAQTTTNTPSGSRNGAVTQPINDLYKALNQIESNSNLSLQQRQDILAPVVDKVFDLNTILKNTVGFRFDTMTPEQKENLYTAFRAFTINRYISAFKQGDITPLKVFPTVDQIESGKYYVVKTHIGNECDSSSVDINYLMAQSANQWRIVDVLLNGNISQIAVQRGDFQSSLAKGGAYALIQQLNEKTKDLNK